MAKREPSPIYEEKHEELAPGVFVELDKKGVPIGIEILNASQNIGRFFRNSMSSHYPQA